mmetsp:Transcript_31424/g.61249  ORF Transcript_31424/g.61249 Transcript_31424/m.61249 type:complete len:260 (+) Transcript_31424:1125-1904(+)
MNSITREALSGCSKHGVALLQFRVGRPCKFSFCSTKANPSRPSLPLLPVLLPAPLLSASNTNSVSKPRSTIFLGENQAPLDWEGSEWFSCKAVPFRKVPPTHTTPSPPGGTSKSSLENFSNLNVGLSIRNRRRLKKGDWSRDSLVAAFWKGILISRAARGPGGSANKDVLSSRKVWKNSPRPRNTKSFSAVRCWTKLALLTTKSHRWLVTELRMLSMTASICVTSKCSCCRSTCRALANSTLSSGGIKPLLEMVGCCRM